MSQMFKEIKSAPMSLGLSMRVKSTIKWIDNKNYGFQKLEGIFFRKTPNVSVI